jgi:hypothetical protein
MPEAKFCPSCGAPRTSVASFCGKCGHRFGTTVARDAPAPGDGATLEPAPSGVVTEERATPPVALAPEAVTSVAPAAGPVTEVAPAVAAEASPALDVMSLAAGALIGIGSILPWYSGGGESISSWDVPLPFLWSETSTATSPDLGIFLVLAAIALVIPAFLRLDLNEWVAVGAGAIAANGAMSSVVRAQSTDIGLGVSLGVFVVLAGAAVVFVDRVRRKLVAKGTAA